MKKLFLLALGLLVTASTFAVSITIEQKVKGDGFSASEWIQFGQVLEGIHKIAGRWGIGAEPRPDITLDVDGMLQIAPIISGGVCTQAIEGPIYFDSTAKHIYGCNGTTWKQLDNPPD